MKNGLLGAINTGVDTKKTQLQAQTYLKNELGMDDEQVLEILKALAAPLKTTLNLVKEAYTERDLKELAETAHSLKGALLNLGLNELANIATMIEESAKNSIEKQLEQDLSYIQASLQGLLDLNSKD